MAMPVTRWAAADRRATAARRLRDVLRADIVHGNHDGGPMPSEAEVAIAHGVSRNTVREALGLLRDEGLITRVQGVGTFAAASKKMQSFNRLGGLRGRGGIHHEMLAMELVPASGVVAHSLGVAEHERVLLLERRTLFEGVPLILWTTYLPTDIGARLMEHQDEIGGDYVELLDSVLDSPLAGSTVSIEVTLSDGDVESLLALPPGHPVFLFQRAYVDVAGRTVDFGFGRCRGDRLSLSLWQSVEGDPLRSAAHPVTSGRESADDRPSSGGTSRTTSEMRR